MKESYIECLKMKAKANFQRQPVRMSKFYNSYRIKKIVR